MVLRSKKNNHVFSFDEKKDYLNYYLKKTDNQKNKFISFIIKKKRHKFEKKTPQSILTVVQSIYLLKNKTKNIISLLYFTHKYFKTSDSLHKVFEICSTDFFEDFELLKSDYL